MQRRKTDQKPVLRVFVSSTIKNLAEVRETLFQVVLTSGHLPIAAEYFTATGAPSLDVIDASLELSDVVVLVVADVHGSQVDLGHLSEAKKSELQALRSVDKKTGRAPAADAPCQGLTFTEYEYLVAKGLGKTVISVVLNESSFSPAAMALIEAKPQFREFRSQVSRDRFTIQAQSLASALPGIALSLDKIATKPSDAIAVGLLPLGDVLGSVWANPVARGVVEELRTYQKLYERHSQSPVLKRALARFICNVVGPHMVRHAAPADPKRHSKSVRSKKRKKGTQGEPARRSATEFVPPATPVSLFLESGSTCLYVAEQLQRSMNGKWLKADILTNNVLAYLHLKLKGKYVSERLSVDMVPGWPEGKWGATYSHITHTASQECSAIEGDLSDEADVAIIAVANDVKERGEDRLVIAATSALATRYFGLPRSQETGRIYEGPHVGSYHNALFKYSLIKSKLPILWVLDATKLGQEFIWNRCSSVVRNLDEWKAACAKQPTAILIAYRLVEDDLEWSNLKKDEWEKPKKVRRKIKRLIRNGELSRTQVRGLGKEFASWGLDRQGLEILPPDSPSTAEVRLMLVANKSFRKRYRMKSLLRDR